MSDLDSLAEAARSVSGRVKTRGRRGLTAAATAVFSLGLIILCLYVLMERGTDRFEDAVIRLDADFTSGVGDETLASDLAAAKAADAARPPLLRISRRKTYRDALFHFDLAVESRLFVNRMAADLKAHPIGGDAKGIYDGLTKQAEDGQQHYRQGHVKLMEAQGR